METHCYLTYQSNNHKLDKILSIEEPIEDSCNVDSNDVDGSDDNRNDVLDASDSDMANVTDSECAARACH